MLFSHLFVSTFTIASVSFSFQLISTPHSGSIDALPIDLAVMDPVDQRGMQQGLDLHILDRTSLHREQIVVFTHQAPIDHTAKLSLEHHVEPDPHASSIAFSKRVGDIHLDLLLDDFIECGLPHGINLGEGCFKIQRGSKAKPTLYDVHRS